MLNYFMARFTHYPNIFPFIGGVLDEGDPSTHTQKKNQHGEGWKGRKKSFTESDCLMLVLNEFGKYVLNIFPPCKIFDYIVSPSTVNTLKLLLLGDEMQMMVHCWSGISVCCILFNSLSTHLYFCKSFHTGKHKAADPFPWEEQGASQPSAAGGMRIGCTEEQMLGIWEITTLQGLKCSWNECSHNSPVCLTVSTSSKTKKLLAHLSSQGKFLWQQCCPWVSHQMCIKDQQNLLIMKIWPAFALLPEWLIGIKHCWMRQLSSHLSSWKKQNNKKLKYLENAVGNLKVLELRREIAVCDTRLRCCGTAGMMHQDALKENVCKTLLFAP